LPVVYYVAGWTLYSAFKALTIPNVMRLLHFIFAALHAIDEQSAKAINLPTSLVEKRKWRVLVYCTWEYFDFICLIEGIYLANLKLKMMLAYDGNIVTMIKTSILLHEATKNSFFCLSGSINGDNNKLLLTYIIEKYVIYVGKIFC
jgi:hypothetical protein